MTTPTDPILDRMSRLHPKAMDLSLGRMRRLLGALDHPERRLPPVVHIAGTNGKGSTLALLSAMLEAAGYRVHRYVSPHLIRFNERILMAGQPIADATLEALLVDVERANEDAPITFFEITTAAAFEAFARSPADILLLETGLGGRLDATNVVPRPLLTLISSISFDHEAWLGSTLTAIAGEKAGIMRRAVPALSVAQRPAAAVTLRQASARIGAPLVVEGRDWRVQPSGDGFFFADAAGSLTLPAPSLVGAHQVENAGLATAAARRLGKLAPPAKAIAAGLQRASWPARLQRVREGRLVDLARPEDELWIDGSHNPDGGLMSAAFFRSLPPRPFRVVLGMLASKDARGYLGHLAPLVDRLITVPVPGSDAGLPPPELASVARSLGIEATAATTIDAALSALAAGPPARLAIMGSLYLAGAALAENG